MKLIFCSFSIESKFFELNKFVKSFFKAFNCINCCTLYKLFQKQDQKFVHSKVPESLKQESKSNSYFKCGQILKEIKVENFLKIFKKKKIDDFQLSNVTEANLLKFLPEIFFDFEKIENFVVVWKVIFNKS